MKFCSFWTLGLISSCFLNTAIAGDLSLAIMPLQTNSVVVTSMSKLVFSSPSIEVKISITPLLIWNVLKKGKCWLSEYILLKGCVTKNNHVPLKELEELLRAYVEKSQKNNIRSVQCRLQEAETSKMNKLIEKYFWLRNHICLMDFFQVFQTPGLWRSVTYFEIVNISWIAYEL